MNLSQIWGGIHSIVAMLNLNGYSSYRGFSKDQGYSVRKTHIAGIRFVCSCMDILTKT